MFLSPTNSTSEVKCFLRFFGKVIFPDSNCYFSPLILFSFLCEQSLKASPMVHKRPHTIQRGKQNKTKNSWETSKLKPLDYLIISFTKQHFPIRDHCILFARYRNYVKSTDKKSIDNRLMCTNKTCIL